MNKFVAAVLGILAVGVVAGSAVALYELVKSSENAARAQETVRAQLAMLGVSFPRAQVDAWTEQLRQIPGVSDEMAERYAVAFASVKHASADTVTALVDLAPIIQKELGSKGPAFAEQMAEAFNDLGEKGEAFLDRIGASPAVINQFYAALKAGDRAAAFEVMLRQIFAALLAADAGFRQ